MSFRIYKLKFGSVICLFVLFVNFSNLKSQDLQLVWSDEFDGTSLDQSIWSFELGQFNDCLHYSTNLSTNTKVNSGKLQLIALKESYQGYDYTASVIKTKQTVNWRYGRIEASIKLPGSNGFVPAFWLLPEDERFGWWPASGEIDIMEHPTNEITTIYGTIHSEAYNSFTGSGPRGGTIDITDAETAFHLYAIEWTPDKIDFYVDNQKYFTFNNEHSGYQTWPFDQPFYIILNMAVGGGWVGAPDENTIFPAVMEIDYVRVYQKFEDFSFYGSDYVLPYSNSLSYSAPDIEGMTYDWSVPNTAQIISGQNSPQINVDWGLFTGTVELLLTKTDQSQLIKYPVVMSNNLLKNSDFEKGAKYWKKSIAYPANADFTISTQDVYSGDHSVFIDVINPGVNTWDIQLSQTNLALKSGKIYEVSFWAKSETNSSITVAIINASNFNLYTSHSYQLTSNWMKYNFTFVASETALGSLNIDLGGHTGKYHFDNFEFNIPAVESGNQISNADFSAGVSEWIFNTFYPAVAQGSVQEGEYVALISNGGSNPWDIHLGQAGLTFEKDKEYTVSFDAYASATREISPITGKNSDPWTVYNDNIKIQLSEYRKTYSYSFIMKEPTDNAARLGFDIGTSSDDVFIDNVFLSKGNFPSDIVEESNSSPKNFQLSQNYPNPFNPLTKIRYTIPSSVILSLSKDDGTNVTLRQAQSDIHVVLKVYDVLGREVATLVNEEQPAGNYEVEFPPASSIKHLASGIYFYQMEAGEYVCTKKMLMLK